jgi:hypothetical protein
MTLCIIADSLRSVKRILQPESGSHGLKKGLRMALP